MFSHFARGLSDKMYDEVPDYHHLYKVLSEALLEYNETNAGACGGVGGGLISQ